MGFLNLFKKNEKSEPIEFSEIAVDMHSHLIPGIDDGAKSMDETIAMLAKFESLGYQKVITTPHIFSDYYKNTPEIIRRGLENVQETAQQLNLKIKIEAAAEYYFDEYFVEQIKAKNVLSFGQNYVLMEFAFMNEPNNYKSVIFDLLSAGYIPVIAHFERYLYWHGSIEMAHFFREHGAKIQLNINSLSGHYGPDVRKQGERLITNDLVDFAGSDCHKIQHLLLLEKSANLKFMHKLLENKLLNRSLV